jgi:hypothetical protein
MLYEFGLASKHLAVGATTKIAHSPGTVNNTACASYSLVESTLLGYIADDHPLDLLLGVQLFPVFDFVSRPSCRSDLDADKLDVTNEGLNRVLPYNPLSGTSARPTFQQNRSRPSPKLAVRAESSPL